MAGRPAPRQDHGPERLAAWSAIAGLLTMVVVIMLSERLSSGQRASGDTALGALGSSFALAAPFVVALASLFVRDVEVRRAVWVASGLLALFLGGLTIFSGVGWLFGAAGIGLLSAWWQTRDRSGSLASWRGVALTVWLIVWFGGALAASWLRETPLCWDASANGSGRSAENTTTMCSSDITDDVEGVLALAGVAVGFAGMAFTGGNDCWRWQEALCSVVVAIGHLLYSRVQETIITGNLVQATPRGGEQCTRRSDDSSDRL
jgi:hypothetical protein